MEIKRTTEIFVEMKRRFIVRQPASIERILCPECGELMLKAEQIADLFRLTPRAVYRLIEAGAAHFVETGAAVYICPPSLDAFISGAANAAFGETDSTKFEKK